MTPAHDLEDAFEPGRIANVRGVEGSSVNPSHHQRAGFGMHDLRGDRRPACAARAEASSLHAIHAVHRNVLADAHDVALAGVVDGDS